jgi:hypothetical protein
MPINAERFLLRIKGESNEPPFVVSAGASVKSVGVSNKRHCAKRRRVEGRQPLRAKLKATEKPNGGLQNRGFVSPRGLSCVRGSRHVVATVCASSVRSVIMNLKMPRPVARGGAHRAGNFRAVNRPSRCEVSIHIVEEWSPGELMHDEVKW